jgi:hypothetical protein
MLFLIIKLKKPIYNNLVIILVNILHHLFFGGGYTNGINFFILSRLNPHKIWIMQKHKKLVMEVNNGVKYVPQGPL